MLAKERRQSYGAAMRIRLGASLVRDSRRVGGQSLLNRVNQKIAEIGSCFQPAKHIRDSQNERSKRKSLPDKNRKLSHRRRYGRQCGGSGYLRTSQRHLSSLPVRGNMFWQLCQTLIDYILTWNFSHTANTITIPAISEIC